MRHFLIVYDRGDGLLQSLEAFATASEALHARFEFERVMNDLRDLEVVAVAADTEADLRRTHARYFLSLDELVARIV